MLLAFHFLAFTIQALNAKGKGEKGCSAVLGARECKKSKFLPVSGYLVHSSLLLTTYWRKYPLTP